MSVNIFILFMLSWCCHRARKEQSIKKPLSSQFPRARKERSTFNYQKAVISTVSKRWNTVVLKLSI